MILAPDLVELFTAVIYEQARAFVLGRHFQPSLMFVSKEGAYLTGTRKAPVGLPRTNTLAYYKH